MAASKSRARPLRERSDGREAGAIGVDDACCGGRARAPADLAAVPAHPARLAKPGLPATPQNRPKRVQDLTGPARDAWQDKRPGHRRDSWRT